MYGVAEAGHEGEGPCGARRGGLGQRGDRDTVVQHVFETVGPKDGWCALDGNAFLIGVFESQASTYVPDRLRGIFTDSVEPKTGFCL